MSKKVLLDTINDSGLCVGDICIVNSHRVYENLVGIIIKFVDNKNCVKIRITDNNEWKKTRDQSNNFNVNIDEELIVSTKYISKY